ncbi:hypothetical protein D3C81_1800010 [compost metagenome]
MRKKNMIRIMVFIMFFSLFFVVESKETYAYQVQYEQAKANGTPSPFGHIVKSIGNSLPIYGDSYSSMDLKVDGVLIQRRYFDIDGKVDMDIDYTNHGNPAQHPVVPHRHNWTWPAIGGSPTRGPWY